MAKLKIQVLGKGLIPRGYGLAPRKDPFNADLTLIQTILSTSGLSIKFLHPEDGRLIPLTKSNLKRIWETYSNVEYKTNKPKEENITKPHVPENNRSGNITNQQSQEHTKSEEVVSATPHQEPLNVNVKPDEPKDENKDDKKEESTTFKPMIQTDNKSNDNNKKDEKRQRR